MIKIGRNLAQAQAEPDVRPDKVSDELRRNALAFVVDFNLYTDATSGPAK
jgi:hypothetical protein